MKIRVGLLMDTPVITHGGPAKYSGNSILLDAMYRDGRFDTYVVTMSFRDWDAKYQEFRKPFIETMKAKGHKIISFDEANSPDILDFMILSNPYYAWYRQLKVPYIYSEYGLDSINTDEFLELHHKSLHKNADIILVSTKDKADRMIELGLVGKNHIIIDKKPAYDYARYAKYDYDSSDTIDYSSYDKVVMYAPHHSIHNTNEADDNKRFSTWLVFKDSFLKLVEKHPNWLFLYKYHPFLEATAKAKHRRYISELCTHDNVKVINGDVSYYHYFLKSDVLLILHYFSF